MADPDGSPSSANLAYVESLYGQYLQDPGSVPASWHQTFEQWARGDGNGHSPVLQVGPAAGSRSLFNPRGAAASITPAPAATPAAPAPSPTSPSDTSTLQHRVDQLVRNYRVRGHICANIDPLGERQAIPEELDPGYYGFTEADMDRPFYFTSTVPGSEMRTLREIIAQMSNTYCRDIGVQFMHIDNLAVRRWLQQRLESTENTLTLSRKEQVRILTRLTDAVLFEEFIQKKFIGAKSFSLEGAESLIPLMDMCFDKAGDQDLKEIVIGMAHRGRLNVLANIIGKSPQKIFREFEDIDPKLYIGGGDVKYHKGYSGTWRTRAGKNIHLSLCFNPSHLEYVNPVVLGRMRAKQDRTGWGTRGEKGMCMLIHGDAAFAGEGVVQETLNLSDLEGYEVGGTMHIVLNNQIGFTTAPRDSRSTRYCTDIFKMLQAPIFHVNGESPEAVAQATQVAMEFRMAFKRDVIIDMYCYRRRGHNEGDEPSFTQPKMYSMIDKRPTTRETYMNSLLKLGGVTQEDADRIVERRTELLEKELTAARSENYRPESTLPQGLWAGCVGGKRENADNPRTSVPRERLSELLNLVSDVPEDFNLHPKLKRLLRLKKEMAVGDRPLDWASCEALGFASLLTEGHPIRISGQDAQRGTFSHRHAVLHDTSDDHTYFPLQNLAYDQAPIEIWNSPLCEAGVLGYEYGYSLDVPNGLSIWEAQFGDFVNCAQVIIDQFITSGEDKWNRLSGLVMLLPHGFEGQGPEHSSARLERFLNQCAEDNMIVAEPTTPAQIFHLLRRQVKRKWRKPLIVMTPKSLLRHPRVVSNFEDLEQGCFKPVIGETEDIDPKKVKRIILCSGKIYYELVERREKLDIKDAAILRLEEYYPFPEDALREALEPYAAKTPVVWVQDEPENMGAWPFLKMKFCHQLFDRHPLAEVTRPASASPASGSRAAHMIEQERVLAAAFGLPAPDES